MKTGSALLLTFFLVGCAGTNPALFRSTVSLPERIAPLEVHIADLDLVQPNEPWAAEMRQLATQEARYQIKGDLVRNVFAPGARPEGFLAIRISRTTRQDINPWLWPTAFSLCMFNMFGMPASAFTTVLSADVKVLDARRVELARYSFRTEGTGYWALYWGHTPTVSLQVAQAEAVNALLAQLKQRLQTDAASINNRLRS